MTAAALQDRFEGAIPFIAASERPFDVVDLAAWIDVDPDPRRWALDRYLPQGEVTLFTGPGGVGKSLFAQQLATCHAAGTSMLGIDTAGGSTLYITAEDDERELHWRQAHLARTLHVPLAALVGKLHLASLRGRMGNELATFDSEGKLKVAPAFGMLRATIEATGARLVFLDNVAHMFVGNENDRAHVTAFANLLNGLCRDLGVTIVLVGHPNKAGDSYSGSTAWLNAVRSQITLGRPEGSVDPDARVLTLGKANYARQGEVLAFRSHDFSFVLDTDLPDDQRAAIASSTMAANDNAVFLRCLAERTRQRRAVSEKSGRNLAPVVFATMPEAAGVPKPRLEAAMDRLFRLGQIERAELWKGDDRKPVFGLRAVAGNAAGNGAETHRANVGEQGAGNAGNTHLPLKGGVGAALGAPAPALGQPSGGQMQRRGDMILAPGETGDEPIPGWEDGG